MPLRELFEGPKKTVIRHGELLTSIWVPTPPPGSASAFARIGRRAGFCLSVVNCAAYVERDDSKLGAIRIALGSVAPTPIFISGVEKLAGRKMTEGLVEDAGRICSEASEPVDDLRGTAEYRREMSAVLARRTLREAWRRTGGEQP